jgi:hypothetical protein
VKKEQIVVLALLVVLLLPAPAMADYIAGTIQGFHCVTQGKVCPVGMEDPLAAVENVFVLHVKSADFYFLPNIPKGVLTRFINVLVRVEGTISVFRGQDKSMHASDMYKKDQHGKWKKVWSSNPKDPIFNEVLLGRPLGGN